MTTVLASTDAVPELVDVLDRRRAQGLDTYDEWWEGVYRIVTGPTPEHGRIAGRLFAFLDALAAELGLFVAAPVNVGLDKDDARVPDIGVFIESTERTSAAFLRTAELVVEVLSGHERPGEKLEFYARWGAKEYLEVDSRTRTVRLLRHDVEQDKWEMATKSAVLPFRLNDDELIADDGGQYRIDWPRDPA